jgi:PucR family transcriptional regulator, purine catabolism regulatory protein
VNCSEWSNLKRIQKRIPTVELIYICLTISVGKFTIPILYRKCFRKLVHIAMSELKRKKVIQELENHLRVVSRQLIKIDTEEEAIQFLMDSFQTKLYCDFVGVILVESEEYILKAWSGENDQLLEQFPIKVEGCSSLLLSKSLKNEDADQLINCELTTAIETTDLRTWFTIPLFDDTRQYGFCLIGFLNYIPLLEMYSIFDEFGKDVAAAISLARRKDRQLKKFENIEWISQKISINETLEENIAEFTLHAAKGTNAESACIYLYNEKEECFVLQFPTFGPEDYPEKIYIKNKNVLKEYFPYLEQFGGDIITIPIVVDLKAIGVIQVERKNNGTPFSNDDRDFLRLLTNHIAVLLENAQLYNNEKEQRKRMQVLLDYQQALVKETVVQDDFQGIINILGDLYKGSVILLDRFSRPLFHNIKEDEYEVIKKIIDVAKEKRDKTEVFKVLEENHSFSVWPVNGVSTLLGYLAVGVREDEIDDVDRLTIELARNICSIQFIKQKLVLDSNEQAKNTFMSKLLVNNIEDKESILQYANLFHWDIYRSHRVVSLSISVDESEVQGLDLLEQKDRDLIVWDYITNRVEMEYQDVLMAPFKEEYLFLVPIEEIEDEERFWREFYLSVKKAAFSSPVKCEVYLGIGSKVENLVQYYTSYEQSWQALNVVENRFKLKGYALFEELGSYTILHYLEDPVVDMFMTTQLGVLLQYSEARNIDLFNTLRTYLQNNGNAKSTSEELFIHRSSLNYRLERAENLLGIDLNDSEVRFNLMMAYKLYDLNGQVD